MATISDITPGDKTIAGEIHISEKTVEFHLNNIYTKIGVRTRMMAGVWTIQQGLQTKTRMTPIPKA
jgi:DNA-binding NarL/FixJ family response regulator